MKNKFLALVLGLGIVGVSSVAVFASGTTSSNTPNSDKGKTCCTQNAPCCVQKAVCCK